MLDFLRKHQVPLTSFLCLLLSLYILASAATGRLRGDPIGPLLLALMRPLQIATHSTVRQVEEIHGRYLALIGLVSENERLKRRIQELEAERNRLLEAETTNRRLRDLLELRSEMPSPSLTAAVIAGSASTWFHSVILDKGSADGVAKGMAVVSPVGAVGQVVEVAHGSSKVLLLTDPYSAVDVIVQRSRARGIVSGSIESGPIMKYVKRSEEIQEGDRLVTSGLDGIFPKGLLVGTVARVGKKNSGLFQDVRVSLSVDPSRLEEVLVVSAGTGGK